MNRSTCSAIGSLAGNVIMSASSSNASTSTGSVAFAREAAACASLRVATVYSRAKTTLARGPWLSFSILYPSVRLPAIGRIGRKGNGGGTTKLAQSPLHKAESKTQAHASLARLRLALADKARAESMAILDQVPARSCGSVKPEIRVRRAQSRRRSHASQKTFDAWERVTFRAETKAERDRKFCQVSGAE